MYGTRSSSLGRRGDGCRAGSEPGFGCPHGEKMPAYETSRCDQGELVTPERLTGLDASFLYLETPTLHMYVAIVAVFDPATVPDGYSFRLVRQRIVDRIPLLPVFQRRLVEVPLRLGHPVWVDDPEFDIDTHLRRAALPSPGGMSELADFAADVISRQLHRDRPLWEMWIVEGLEDGKIALVVKMHHSTIDGVSGAELLGVLFDLEPNPPETHPQTARTFDS